MFSGESSPWTPIPELVRLDGDSTIIFLSGAGVRFFQPMEDDWYRATTSWHPLYSSAAPVSQPTWRPDVSASPMGCFEQHQWCNSAYPRDRGCGPLSGWIDSIYAAAPFFNVTNDTLASDRPISYDATSARLIWPWLAMDFYPVSLVEVLDSLSTRSLASQSTLFEGIQLPLPESQWQLDTLQWWHIILAAVQASRLVVPHYECLFFFALECMCSHSKIPCDYLANLPSVS